MKLLSVIYATFVYAIITTALCELDACVRACVLCMYLFFFSVVSLNEKREHARPDLLFLPYEQRINLSNQSEWQKASHAHTHVSNARRRNRKIIKFIGK